MQSNSLQGIHLCVHSDGIVAFKAEFPTMPWMLGAVVSQLSQGMESLIAIIALIIEFHNWGTRSAYGSMVGQSVMNCICFYIIPQKVFH